MNDPEHIAAYVDAAAQLIGLPLDPAHRVGVVKQFTGVANVARLVMEFPLPAEIEPATVLRHD